ncbi:hypothetical protein ACKRZS_012721 [Fusarium odoratissimum]|nr:hypothetical protein NOF04DRAFT_1385780 [Fusarium oxysporum II5]
MLVSILTSGTGLSAVSTPISGAMMFFSGAIAQDDLENAYGKAFPAVLKATNGYAKSVLSGNLPDNM